MFIYEFLFKRDNIKKVYEDINYDSIKNQLHNLLQNEKEKLKGEFVIVIPKNEENNNQSALS